ncbi:19754_t:CDS:2 [Dentiscutata erythropus]|uniref:19754_t:CDS:1 n=1 Tax=Dentiscutata erythropus TaxID=1348616 RepID=A0A9N9HLX0_9GLOM|nr:19754_t:CDS:2 [Dentiscutata erythropus]
MIPSQQRRLTFYEDAQKVIIKQNPWIKFINVILALIIFILFTAYDFNAIGVLNKESEKLVNSSQRLKYNDNHGLEIIGWCCWSIYLHVLCFYIIRFFISPPWKNTENFYYVKPGKWRTLIKFLLIDILLSCLNIPLSYPYLKESITSCNIESLDSAEYEWCTIRTKLVILAWLSIFIWFLVYLIYLTLIFVILCEKVYVILKSWVIYQYQYMKGLYLIWIRKEKLKKQSEIEIEESKDLISKSFEDNSGENAKYDINEADGFEIVTTK